MLLQIEFPIFFLQYLSPRAIAIQHIEDNKDPPYIEERFINEQKGIHSHFWFVIVIVINLDV